LLGTPVINQINKYLDEGVDIDTARNYGTYNTKINTEIAEFRYTDEESQLNNCYVIDYMEAD
jgi:hypothetical protein